VLALLGLAAAAVAGFVGILVPMRRREAVESWHRDLEIRTEVRRDALSRYFADGLADAATLAAFPSAREALAEPQGAGGAHPHLELLFTDFLRIHKALGVALWDAEGRARVTRPGPRLGTACVEPVRDALATGEPAVGIHLHAPLGPVLTFTAPVRDSAGAVRGVVVVAADPSEWLYPFLAPPIAGSATGEALLVAREGPDAVVLSPVRHDSRSLLSVRQRLGATLPAYAVFEGRKASGSFVDYRGARIFAEARDVPPAPWALVVKIDETEALSEFRDGIRRSAVVWGALFVAVLGVTWGLWQFRRRRRAAERAHTERELWEGRAKLEAALASIPDAVFISDASGRCVHFNDAFATFHRFRDKAECARHLDDYPAILDVFLADGTPAPLEMWAVSRALRGETATDAEYSLRRKDTGETWIGSYTFGPIHDRDGMIVGSVVVGSDVTDRRRAESELRTSEERYRALFESNLDAVLLTTPAGQILAANAAACRMFGRTEEDLKSTGRGVGDPSDPRVAAAIAERHRTGRFHGDLSLLRKDGTTFTGEVASAVFTDSLGVARTSMVIRDISERQQLEAQLQQAQKMEAVGRLAGGVAHDFNNLLTVIQGYGELLAASVAGDPDRSESAAEIVKAAERAAALTRQLLAFSRQQVLEPRVFDVGAVLGDTQKMLRRLIGEDVEVVFETPAGLGRVKADSGQVEQVLLNLAVNARDAMPDGGRLAIELENVLLDEPLAATLEPVPPGAWVVLKVTDTGCGMDAATLTHIFEPFFTTKPKGKGTGLGLATAYGIVRQTGGFVDVDSAPGRGTTFRVFLPACEEPVAKAPHSGGASGRGDGTILLVEDEDAVRRFVKTVLERLGYFVLVAANGAEALAIVERDTRRIDLLLTDLVMPGMNGRDLASAVRTRRPSVAVVFMSGYAAEVAPVLDPDAPDGFLMKPFSESALAEKIRAVLDVRGA
jgi:PAS domain S-box-containing protein